MNALVRWPDATGFWAHRDNLPLPRAGVYSITHIASDKRYIGCSCSVAERLRSHSRQYKSARQEISISIATHGNAAFIVDPLYYGINKHYILEHEEAFLIDELLSWYPKGYNVACPAWIQGENVLLPLPQAHQFIYTAGAHQRERNRRHSLLSGRA